MKQNLNVEDLGLCACGRRIYADAEQCAVVHELPYCEKFLRLEPLEFLRYVRRSRGLPDPPLKP